MNLINLFLKNKVKQSEVFHYSKAKPNQKQASISPKPVNVTLFHKKVFEEVIKLKILK
jgi:hypothetical protein